MMNQIRFDTLRYFAKVYFNCSMNWSDLENLIDDFMMRENKQIIDDFKNEIDILYMYAMENTMSAKDIAGILTCRATKNQEAESIIKLFYDKRIPKIRYRNICYFYNCRLGCHIGLFDLEKRIEAFLMWENIMTLEKEVDIIYKLNDSNLMKEVERLEDCIETFLMEENKERVEAFRKEVETVYTLISNKNLMKKISYRFGGDIRIPIKKDVSVIKLLYDKCIKEEK